MTPLLQFAGYTLVASVCAFLKLFYKTDNYNHLFVLGLGFALTEFLLRLPTKTLGIDILGLSVYSMQIIWITTNVIMSAVLSVIIYGAQMTMHRLVGMMIMLFGVSIVLG